ncbi:hypothetical protein GCM10010324_50550 [Streptomyces hiroshimensis]|uniref:Uncharacterized protein n=1 Tax=Streptomyces hiroshimensis TaxID=66424 RepID=A0ABQ2YZ64_9ACTN|nr:hypothetical protein GCM10010324_50550 [Streptomyces hiroshimensis]
MKRLHAVKRREAAIDTHGGNAARPTGRRGSALPLLSPRPGPLPGAALVHVQESSCRTTHSPQMTKAHSAMATIDHSG